MSQLLRLVGLEVSGPRSRPSSAAPNWWSCFTAKLKCSTTVPSRLQSRLFVRVGGRHQLASATAAAAGTHVRRKYVQ